MQSGSWHLHPAPLYKDFFSPLVVGGRDIDGNFGQSGGALASTGSGGGALKWRKSYLADRDSCRAARCPIELDVTRIDAELRQIISERSLALPYTCPNVPFGWWYRTRLL